MLNQAANDYQFALDELHKDKYNRQAKRVKRECEKFFNSDWFNILTNLDSEVLVADIKRM